MGGIFDDVFDDDDWGQKDDAESSPEDEFESDLWSTGSKTDQWNTDDPWTSEPTSEELDEQDSFDMSDFFD